MIYDYIIIGGGIVGVSTAWQLQQRYPDKKVLLLEKESEFATHQTGHNSGVIHAGVYYEPGSLKAKFCRAGVDATINFCQQHNIPFNQCGKLLVATNELEVKRMEALYQRCQKNNIEVELLDKQQLKIEEPNITGLGAILVRSTGIVDYQLITIKMAQEFQSLGGECRLNTKVTQLKETAEEIRVSSNQGEFYSRYLITCSGLMADRVVKMLDIKVDFQIVPFRGEYYQLPANKNAIVNHLIYPIPDPTLPFLGVHLTRMIDGSVTVGPNAVLGFKREGYGKININLRDIKEMVMFAGFWKVLGKNLSSGITEFKNSLFKKGYLTLVRKYCPSIELSDLKSYPAGIRAQAVMNDGSLVHDFLFANSERTINVCNAPSPAATSAIPIGGYIVDKVSEHFCS
ncbi:L-2-hydroxyglutarate oxidase [Colwellia psychrerythraea]|uniref:FAD-dependent oxidoreductase n=1 Tax=Colwellia psychrerythraea (strain 34H / ATCC BAA-681) TaxID=167879 RepID=Q47V68_COLP3|nr:L-2-hydroxyglutarate oxidase [Colwellia psychrerythraea]AAZ24122.1 FAD-dependent oxidoreductase [Colwellia psychrerythraea 34H]